MSDLTTLEIKNKEGSGKLSFELCRSEILWKAFESGKDGYPKSVGVIAEEKDVLRLGLFLIEMSKKMPEERLREKECELKACRLRQERLEEELKQLQKRSKP